MNYQVISARKDQSQNGVRNPQVSQARYTSTLTFAFLRNSINLHIYKDLYGERNKTEKNEKLTVELQ